VKNEHFTVGVMDNDTTKTANIKIVVLGSHGCSFRIRHEHVRAASSGVGLTMTSYPVGNKTSLSQKDTSQIKSCCSLSKLIVVK